MRKLLRRVLGQWLAVEIGRAIIVGIYMQRKRNRERHFPVAPEL